MKKIIIFASVLALILTTGGNVYATDASSAGAISTTIQEITVESTVDTKQTREEKKAAFEQRKAEISALRAEVKLKREAVKENREKNKAIAEENKNLRETLTAKLKALKDSGTTLDAETAAKLEECNEELKTLTAALKETKGDIKEIISENKGNVKALDYEAIEAEYTEISNIQVFRYETLVQINETLKEMIALL